jgi:phospholipase C
MNTRGRRWIAAAALVTMLNAHLGTSLAAAGQGHADGGDGVATATPIKHVIILIGENRTFDNVYGTYVPKHGQTVWNLLSRGIVNADGSPGPNKDAAEQFLLKNPIDPLGFFISTRSLNKPGKTLYSPFLPTPEAGSAPALPVTLAQLDTDPAPAAPPFDANTFSFAQLHALSPVFVDHKDLTLHTTGATGLKNCQQDPTEPPTPCAGPDTRTENFDRLPNTAFQITGPNVPYDSYTGDMVHRFFHMWQQSDCHVMNATSTNPSGCLNDLYPFIGIARGDDSGSNAMGFYNVHKGDAPVFKRLADEYTMSDNYHQPVMGGTAVQHTMLGTADSIFWEDVGNLPAQPPANRVAYWDSGFFQPIDFFGDGPRIPFIAVSKYSRGGKIVHSYADHASVVKFIERNWHLQPLTGRSRDNLPNPVMTANNPYVPLNMPAVSDLFEMFDFDAKGDDD